MSNLEISNNLRSLMDLTFENAKKIRSEYVTPEHLLRTAIDDDDVMELFFSCGSDLMSLADDLDEYISENVYRVPDSVTDYEPVWTEGITYLIESAGLQCKSSGRKTIEMKDILVSMMDEQKLYCSYLMKKSGLSRMELLEFISFERYGGFSAPDGSAPQWLGDDSEFHGQDDSGSSLEEDFLSRYTTDLTEQAVKGGLDILVGREDELDRTIQTLCRRTKNNPLHVGEAGVGKTAITQGLAQKIVNGDVPDFLKGFSIYSLNMGTLVAGTKFRGEFEERLKRVIDALLKKEKAIVFIDEIHTIVGAGESGNGALDAANILKPVLGGGKIRCIGSTTFEEYTRVFEKDRALARRFQKIDVLEPSRDDCVKILKALSSRYASFHNVVYEKGTLETAVDLAVQYLPDRRLPDKAIDIMDEAGSYAKIHLKSSGGKKIKVDEDVIRKVTSKMARVPVEAVHKDEKDRLAALEEKLKSSIFGQDEAVESVVLAVKKSRAGFRNPEKPEGVFLFVGPTGVGKTELARELAAALGEKLVRFDMSEYQEKHTVSRLIGSPPGYVGFEEGGLLTDALRKEPHSVVLLDEIEKAHPDIYNVLLQVMDYGTLTDNQGRKADFRNSILIMTSNAGAREMEAGAVGFSTPSSSVKNDRATLNNAVEKAFTPEFRNRLDKIIPFDSLSEQVAYNIADKEIKKIASRLLAKKVRLRATKKAVQLVAKKGYSREFGARPIARTADAEIAAPLVDIVLFGELSCGGKVLVDAVDGKCTFNVQGAVDAGKPACKD